MCRAQREGESVRASVRPEQLPLSDPLARIDGGSSCVHFELDILPGLTIIERDAGLDHLVGQVVGEAGIVGGQL